MQVSAIALLAVSYITCVPSRTVHKLQLERAPPSHLGLLRASGHDHISGKLDSRSLLALERSQHIPKRDHSCSSNAECGYHAKCDAQIGECASLKFGEDLRFDVAMGVLGFLTAGISLAAGVGGGGLNVPLLMLVLSFDAHVATAMSQAMLTGGALAAFIYNYNGKHPRRSQRPLINYELASLIGASVVAGAQVGSVIHATAPPALILILLCVVLTDAARKGVKNAMKISEKEAEEAAVANKEKSTADIGGDPIEDDEHAPKIWERASAAKRNLLVFWLLCVALIVGKNLFFRICTRMWWGMTIAGVLFLGGFAYKIAHDLSSESPVDEEDLDFTSLAMPMLRMCVLAGCLAALCGIGGGMVIGPILIEMKVPPPVTAATTATTLLVLASSTCLVYACRGTAPWRYALVLSACTFLGAGTGKVLIGRWVQKTGKQSAIVWILAGITIVSTILMACEGAKTVMKDGYQAFYFRNFCRGHRSDVSPQEEIRSPEIPHEQLDAFLQLAVKTTIGCLDW